MNFLISELFSKYILNTIYDNVINLRKSNLIDESSEDILYYSYLKLEELLKEEFK